MSYPVSSRKADVLASSGTRQRKLRDRTLGVGRRPSLGCPAPPPAPGRTPSQPVPHQGSGGLVFLMGPYLLTISVTAVLPSGLVAGAGGGFAEG